MGSTIVEKILARHAGRDVVQAGEVVVAEVDYAMVTDTRAVNTIKLIDSFGDQPLRFANKTSLVLDHYSPPPNQEAADIHSSMRAFATKRGTGGTCQPVLSQFCKN